MSGPLLIDLIFDLYPSFIKLRALTEKLVVVKANICALHVAMLFFYCDLIIDIKLYVNLRC